jgi:hypothetical protein
MSGVELVLAFLAGVVMGGALDRLRPGSERLHVRADRPSEGRGWDAAFGLGVVRVKEGQSGRGESV